MKQTFLCLFLLTLSHPILAADPPIVAHAAKLKNQYFKLRAHEDLLGSPAYSRWNGRPIYTIYAAADQEQKWPGKYFVSEAEFRVKDVDFDKRANSVLLKMWTSSGEELRFYFPEAKTLTAEAFDQAFFRIFFGLDEDIEAFIRQNDALLIQEYLNPEIEMSALPLEERAKILKAIKSIGGTGKPKLDRLNGELYLSAYLPVDPSVYNDLQVSKNQRIASTVESKLASIKDAARFAKDLPAIRGIHFHWNLQHRDFLHEASGAFSETEIFAPLGSIVDLAAGNLSVLEFVNASLLRVDGTKITLTSWDPIGAR